VAHHELARTIDPYYLFHQGKRNCWAVIVAPHESTDVAFVNIDAARETHHQACGEWQEGGRVSHALGLPGGPQDLPAGSL
jgi:hypothetical protein